MFGQAQKECTSIMNFEKSYGMHICSAALLVVLLDLTLTHLVAFFTSFWKLFSFYQAGHLSATYLAHIPWQCIEEVLQCKTSVAPIVSTEYGMDGQP